jgi:hypothetical protein
LLRGDLARLLAGPEQARILDRLQAVMSVIEGHAERHGRRRGPVDPLRRLRERLEARRASRGGLGEVILRILGLELKLRQYTVGKAFCDVVAEAGIEGLNQVWRAPRRCRPRRARAAAGWLRRGRPYRPPRPLDCAGRTPPRRVNPHSRGGPNLLSIGHEVRPTSYSAPRLGVVLGPCNP